MVTIVSHDRDRDRESRRSRQSRRCLSMGLTLAKPSTAIPISDNSVSVLETCDCDYQSGGCVISKPAPSGKACQCRYKLIWTCEGSLINCDTSLSKCLKPDHSKESCELGQGDCDGY